MQLHAHAADDTDAFAEIDLRVAGQMDERDEDHAQSGAGDPHVILHHRVAADVAMFDPQPFENKALGSALRRKKFPRPGDDERHMKADLI